MIILLAINLFKEPMSNNIGLIITCPGLAATFFLNIGTRQPYGRQVNLI